MRRTALLGALLVTCLTWSAASAAGVAAAPPAPRPVVGDTKTACVYTFHRLSLLHEFERNVGRKSSCVVLFNDAVPQWAGWENPWFLHHGGADYAWPSWLRSGHGSRTAVVTQALVPAGVPADWRRRGAAGEYDAHARALATALVAKGFGTAIIRLGHEANGDWYKDSIGNNASDHRDWRLFWARTVRTMRSVRGAHFTFDWTVNSGNRAVPFADYYPGDDVVDVIGIDNYDGLPEKQLAAGASRWRMQYTRRGGARDLIAFAERHHRPLSFPEWGLVLSNTKAGGGDDANYVTEMARLIRTHRVRYQGLWYHSSQGPQLTPKTSPRAFAAYRKLFGGGG